MGNKKVSLKVGDSLVVDTGIVLYPDDVITITATGRFKFKIFGSLIYAYPEGVYEPKDQIHDGFDPEEVVGYPFNGKSEAKFRYPSLSPYSMALLIGEVKTEAPPESDDDLVLLPVVKYPEKNKWLYTNEILQGTRNGIATVEGGGGSLWLHFNKIKKNGGVNNNNFKVTLEIESYADDGSVIPLPDHSVSPIRSVPFELQAKKESGVFKTAFFWYVVPKTGPIEAYTNWDRDLACPQYIDEYGLQGNEVPAMLYKSNRAVELTSIPTSVKNDVKAPDVTAIRLDNQKILGGYYEGAYVEIFEADPYGTRVNRTLHIVGEMGEAEVQDYTAKIEVTPITEWVNRPIGGKIGVICDVGRLPDETAGRGRCSNQVKHDGWKVEDWTRGAMVVAVYSTAKLTVGPMDVSGESGYEDSFPASHGRVIGVTGVNTGIVRPIGTLDTETGTLTLRRSLPNVPAIGDTFLIEAGCDGSLEMCRDVWDNVKNRRAYDFVPSRGDVRRRYRAS